jgi:hypothetical protein
MKDVVKASLIAPYDWMLSHQRSIDFVSIVQDKLEIRYWLITLDVRSAVLNGLEIVCVSRDSFE